MMQCVAEYTCPETGVLYCPGDGDCPSTQCPCSACCGDEWPDCCCLNPPELDDPDPDCDLVVCYECPGVCESDDDCYDCCNGGQCGACCDGDSPGCPCSDWTPPDEP